MTKRKIIPLLLVIFFSLIFMALIAYAAIRFIDYFEKIETISASGRQNLAFRVFYMENTPFPENPIPPNWDFLMSYTDFIEIDSSFNATFSQEMDIQYSYRAEKRVVIRPMPSGRSVFESHYILTEKSGETRTSRLSFNTENDGPGGMYTIFPKEHIDLYRNFVVDQARQMEAENVIAQGLRGFSAVLYISFTYTVRVPEFGINETVTHGYRIPLTTEIYTLNTTGISNFAWEQTIGTTPADIDLQTAVHFVTLFIFSLAGLLYNIKKLLAHPNPRIREAESILKKYSHEIVIYDRPVSMSHYEPRMVQEFGELLKLAVNLNKHIMCYRHSEYTEFAVIVDNQACIYDIEYHENNENPQVYSEKEAEEKEVSNP